MSYSSQKLGPHSSLQSQGEGTAKKTDAPDQPQWLIAVVDK